MGLKPGTQAGAYTVERTLGSGAMSLVYLGRNKLGQPVAIKALPEQMAANPAAVKRFEREARLISQLDHPHIVRVLDFFYAGDTPCLVMQYLPGGTLSAYLADVDALTLGEAVAIVRQLAEALHYAHRLNIIHRDLKPDNVLLYDSGQVALADFGLGRALHETTLTATGSLLGTPYYMSPEQIQPQQYQVDHRADIYALGILAYLLVTGRYPYSGTDAASIMLQHITAPVPVPSRHNPALPAALDPVLMRAIAKDPDIRYHDALDFAAALDEAAAAAPDLPVRMQALRPVDDEDDDAVPLSPTTPPLPPRPSRRPGLGSGPGSRNGTRPYQPPPPAPRRPPPALLVLAGIGLLLAGMLAATVGRDALARLLNPAATATPAAGSATPAAGSAAVCSGTDTTVVNLTIQNTLPQEVGVLLVDAQCTEREQFRLAGGESRQVLTTLSAVWQGVPPGGQRTPPFTVRCHGDTFTIGPRPRGAVAAPGCPPSPRETGG